MQSVIRITAEQETVIIAVLHLSYWVADCNIIIVAKTLTNFFFKQKFDVPYRLIQCNRI
jgi:hypothetical protein